MKSYGNDSVNRDKQLKFMRGDFLPITSAKYDLFWYCFFKLLAWLRDTQTLELFRDAATASLQQHKHKQGRKEEEKPETKQFPFTVDS